MVSQTSSETPKFQVSIPQTSTPPWESVTNCPGEQAKVERMEQKHLLLPNREGKTVRIISGKHGQKQNFTTF